ncbi:ABC transporter substrate-binding protein [Frankia sp. QA3]|uniref:ABC transporter substrate-binding protein n=1 Tax=Frankia sp. QA3 TaxID=710111 RepID=UPI000269C247|nr:ABC transporter substrate-binding protein [Frankia sp. QA3]EIV92802.1 ABC-type dipeptide/oligopeptide/nickel transport system, ATPase component [Frankia sp. QA3]
MSGEPAATARREPAAPLLAVHELAVHYRLRREVTHAVRSVSLSVLPGQTVAVVGESGSGKSTVAQAVLGLLPGSARLTGGRILFDGQDLIRLGERRFRPLRGNEIALIPQDPGTALNPVARIGHQVAEALLVHGATDRHTVPAEVRRILADAGVDEPERRTRQYPHELSGGLRQRVKINPSLVASLRTYQETRVVDPSTVTFVLKTSDAPFLQALTSSSLGGLVAPATLALPFDQRFDNVIGSGPFVLEKDTKDTEVVLKKRTGYRWASQIRKNRGDAYLDRVVFRVVPEASSRIGSLRSGELQTIDDVPADQIKSVREDGLTVLSRSNPGAPYALVAISSPRPPLDDVNVRRALLHAVDTAEIRDTVLSPEFKAATGVLSSTTPGYLDLSSTLTYDPAESKRLLDAAGWAPGADGIRQRNGARLTLTVGWLPIFSASQTALELTKAQLAKVGVELELSTSTTDLKSFQNITIDLFLTSTTRADGEALASYGGEPPNYYHLNDPTLDSLLARQRAIGDPAARDKVLADAQRRVVDQATAIPLFEGSTVLAASTSVHDLAQSSNSWLAQLSDTWLS